MDTSETGVGDSLARIGAELRTSLDAVGRHDPASLARLADLAAAAPRVFLLGAGRSGLALQMTAMRLMHLGLAVHVVGEVTSPAIGAGDLLITASGSGTTRSIVAAAESAVAHGADVAAITTAPGSPLATLASVVIRVQAAEKLDRSGSASEQYAGSLFEQTIVLLGDALFHTLWKQSGQDADLLWTRHSNLE